MRRLLGLLPLLVLLGAPPVYAEAKKCKALVSFFVGEDATVVFLVRDGAVRANAVNLTRQDLTTVVTELRAGVDWVQNSGADFDTRLSQKLHQILLGGFAAELAGVAHLIFVSPKLNIRAGPMRW